MCITGGIDIGEVTGSFGVDGAACKGVCGTLTDGVDGERATTSDDG